MMIGHMFMEIVVEEKCGVVRDKRVVWIGINVWCGT